MLGLFRTVDMMRRHVADVLAPAGITHQQYNVLRILRGAGEEGLPTLAIADRMIERTPGITRLVDRLIAKGWVSRERSAGDRRRVQCRLTAAGLELVNSLDGAVNSSDEQVLCMLDEDDKERLIELLDHVREGLRQKGSEETEPARAASG